MRALQSIEGAGAFNHKITIQSDTPTIDAGGGRSNSWGTYSQPWARVAVKQAFDRVEGGGDQQARRTEFTLREFVSGVTSNMRVSWDSRTFDIESVYDPDGSQNHLVLVTKEARVA